ncbi:MAG TPA: hypothetical protein VKU19_21135 [Bryobacteraceae bacterium]|nr:hypothetical protein [Bryobacteraceae bacterium]
MLLHYRDGRVLAAILLSLKGDLMRVALKDADDVLELRLVNGVWITENCELVTFEFPTAVFEAVGMIPDAHSVNPKADFFWHLDTVSEPANLASNDELPN